MFLKKIKREKNFVGKKKNAVTQKLPMETPRKCKGSPSFLDEAVK